MKPDTIQRAYAERVLDELRQQNENFRQELFKVIAERDKIGSMLKAVQDDVLKLTLENSRLHAGLIVDRPCEACMAKDKELERLRHDLIVNKSAAARWMRRTKELEKQLGG